MAKNVSTFSAKPLMIKLQISSQPTHLDGLRGGTAYVTPVINARNVQGVGLVRSDSRIVGINESARNDPHRHRQDIESLLHFHYSEFGNNTILLLNIKKNL
jgi:hypothetical protein